MADWCACALDITRTAVETHTPMAPTHVGALLGNYVVTRMLGLGGMGVVYAAEHVRSGHEVAIKVLPGAAAADPRAIRRFMREVRSAAGLRHPNVVAVLEVGQRDDTYYMVMELAEAGSLAEALDSRGALGPGEATRIVADVCRALTAAHGAGLVHRDVKPANILLTADHEVKLGDFGLARSATQAVGSVTHIGQVVGTPSFMSPEQCHSERVDLRADIYSLGATYYALLTGRGPYAESTTMPMVMFAHCYHPVPDPREVRPDIPEACAAIVRRAMAKDPGDRYQSADEMLADLEAAATGSGGHDGARPDSIPRPDLRVGATTRIHDGSGRRSSRSPAARCRPRRPRRALKSA